MTIASVRLRLQTLQQSIPGIIRAYAQLPRGIVPAAEMPAFLNFVRTGRYDDEVLGDSDVQTTRQFLMWLLIKPANEGEEGEGEELTEPWVETIANYFYARPTLGNLIGISYSHIVEDSGPKRLVFPGTIANPLGIYWGVEFRLDVIGLFKRIYADNE